MERHENTIFNFTKDKNDILLTTSHEENDSSITIHCSAAGGYGGFSMYISQGQAENLIHGLQKCIINLEAHKKTKEA